VEEGWGRLGREGKFRGGVWGSVIFLVGWSIFYFSVIGGGGGWA